MRPFPPFSPNSTFRLFSSSPDPKQMWKFCPLKFGSLILKTYFISLSQKCVFHALLVGPATCKWSPWRAGLLQMIIQKIAFFLCKIRFRTRMTRCKINLTYQSPKPLNLKVVEMVLNTQCYQYLWLTMWFYTETLPEAQRTRGLSSYHKITVHKSWTYYNFRISIKH